MCNGKNVFIAVIATIISFKKNSNKFIFYKKSPHLERCGQLNNKAPENNQYINNKTFL